MFKSTRLTYKLAINRFGQKSLFEFAGFKVILNKHMKNPLRQDDSPGCWFAYDETNTLRFYDFSGFFTPFVSINCFDAIKIKYELEDKYVLSYIRKNSSKIKEKPDNVIIIEDKKKIRKKKKVEIRFIEGEYPEDNLYTQIGITNSILSKENIFFPKSYECNFAGSKDMIKNQIYDPADTVCVINLFPNNKTSQLYFPEKKKCRYIGTGNVESIKGLDMLDIKGDVLYITKGVKDYMAGRYVANLNIISILSERYVNLPQWVIEKIKKNYKQVVILFDSDKTGVDISTILAEKYNFNNHIRLIPLDLYDYAKYSKTEFINYFKYFNEWYSNK